MLPVALDYAHKLLNSNPLNHPNCYVFEPTTKKSMGVEVSNEILKIVEDEPQNSDYYVIIIKGFDKMTEDAQNILLKLIEESKTVVVLGTATSEESILVTIKSRMKIEYQTRPSLKQFVQAGNEYWKFFCEDESEEEILSLMYAEMENKTYCFLKALYMIKEKDPLEYKGNYKPVVNMITSKFIDERNGNAVMFINQNAKGIEKWTAQDAFLFFIELEELVKETNRKVG